jgi:hypothetical protein
MPPAAANATANATAAPATVALDADAASPGMVASTSAADPVTDGPPFGVATDATVSGVTTAGAANPPAPRRRRRRKSAAAKRAAQQAIAFGTPAQA